MYDAIWLEIDRDPQRPAQARVDVETKDGNICIWCDPNGNVACVTHKKSQNESDRLAEAIESCLTFGEVMDDYLRECPDVVAQETQPMDAWDAYRLDCLMDAYAGI